MRVLDLTSYPIDDIKWTPTAQARQKRGVGGAFRGHHAGPLMFDGTVEVAAIPYQQAREFDAKLEALDGMVQPFELIIPVVCFPSGSASLVAHGGPNVISGGGNTLVTNGWPANTPDLFKAGDLVRLVSPSKMYKVAANTGSNASGVCSIVLTRPLLHSPAGGENLVFNPASFVVSQPIKAQEYEIPGNKFSAFEIDFEEVVL